MSKNSRSLENCKTLIWSHSVIRSRTKHQKFHILLHLTIFETPRISLKNHFTISSPKNWLWISHPRQATTRPDETWIFNHHRKRASDEFRIYKQIKFTLRSTLGHYKLADERINSPKTILVNHRVTDTRLELFPDLKKFFNFPQRRNFSCN